MSGLFLPLELAIANFDYDHIIMAEIDGQPADVIDNGDGSYTVKNVNGSLTVKDEKTPKTFPVTLSGDTDDLTAPEEAAYGTDYEFSIKPAEGFEYKVKATVNGKNVPDTGDANGSAPWVCLMAAAAAAAALAFQKKKKRG